MKQPVFKSGKDLSAKSVIAWRAAQTAVWLVGAVIFFCLLFYPALGISLLWDVLIPVAPLLFVLSVGLWRNVCPLAITNLLPRRFNVSKKKKMPVLLQSKLNLISVAALYIIVPLRHAFLNTNGIATALLMLAAVIIGVAMGFVYDWKSGWCSSLCPIHPVEKLYGGNTLITLPNAHCDLCVNCSVPCPDSTPNVNPAMVRKNSYQKLSAVLIAGGFPGFVWGWFHVPDQLSIHSFAALAGVYVLPFAGMMVTLLIYLLITAIAKAGAERLVINIFAAAAVSCYYWYRIPNLFGFGMFNKDGMLVDLKNRLPEWGITAISLLLVAFFFYWLVIRKENKKSWTIRPAFLQQ